MDSQQMLKWIAYFKAVQEDAGEGNEEVKLNAQLTSIAHMFKGKK